MKNLGIEFENKMAIPGITIVQSVDNGLTGDALVAIVEFSDGGVGIFDNGQPEWVGSWEEALDLTGLDV